MISKEALDRAHALIEKVIDQCLIDQSAMAAAINGTQYLREDGNKFIVDDGNLQEVLSAIDETPPSVKYTRDSPERQMEALLSAGFTQQELEVLRPSEIIKYSAMIFTGIADVTATDDIQAVTNAIIDGSDEDSQLVLRSELNNLERELLPKRAGLHIKKYQALQALQDDLQTLIPTIKNPALKKNAQQILNDIVVEKNKCGLSVPLLTETLTVVNDMIRNPTEENAVRCRNQAERFPQRSMIGRNLMIFCGVLLIVVAVALAITSSGVSIPLSLLAINHGVSIIAAAVASGAAAFVGVGLLVGAVALSKANLKDTLNSISLNVTSLENTENVVPKAGGFPAT